jgi:hypothetical protein
MLAQRGYLIVGLIIVQAVHLAPHEHYEYQSTARGSPGHEALHGEHIVSLWLISINSKQLVVRAAARNRDNAQDLCAAAALSSPMLTTLFARLKVFSERVCNRPSDLASTTSFRGVLAKTFEDHGQFVKFSTIMNTGPKHSVSCTFSSVFMWC